MDVADLERALGAVLDDLGPVRARVGGVGVAGMAESGAPVAGGRPLAPVIAWHDGRGEQTVARLGEALGADLALRIGQRLRAVSSVAKLGWLLEHGVARPERWLGVPELCLHCLTGAEATEHSLAVRTGAYDVAERAWMPEVADVLGVDRATFAPVLAAGAVMGRVSPAGAGRFGLPEGVPVTVAGHDHLAGAEAVGAGTADVCNSVGTAETLLRRTPLLPDRSRALALGLAVTLRPGGTEWVVLASATRSGLVLESLAAALARPPGELDDLAQAAEALPGPVRPRARRTLASGIEVPDGPPGVVWAGALGALSARTVAAAARLSTLFESPGERMIVYGGGSRSRPWVAAKAAAAGLPVLRSRAAETTARGAALFAGVAAGWWSSTAEGPAAPLEPVEFG
jgi:xylulokinase